MIDLPRSTFYFPATTTELSDVGLVTFIEDIQDELRCYDYRRAVAGNVGFQAVTKLTSTSDMGAFRTIT